MPKEWTALKIAMKLKPRATRYTTCVARNLYVITQPSGAKSWAFRFSGEKLVLGIVDLEAKGEPEIGRGLSLHGAKELAAKVRREGMDEHRAAKQRKRTEIKEADANTFGVLVRQFAEEHLQAKRKGRYMAKQLGLAYPKFEKALRSAFSETKNGLAQRWRELDVRTIDGSHIYSVLNEARRHGTPGIKARKRGLSDARARDLHTPLSLMFKWLKQNRHIDVNPCIDVWKSESAKPRQRVLADGEIKAFWHGCGKIHPTFAAVFRLLLLTGCRLREISEMRRTELDGDTLNLPGARTKNAKPHVVPLAPLAMEIIAAVPRIEGCPFVFSTNGKTPVSGWTKIKKALDIAMGKLEAWTIHDLRRTAVTGMNELGIRPDVVELIVNHISGHRRGVAGVYNRAERIDERRDALRRWSQHINGLISGAPSKVIKLQSR
jgi:integrase